MRKKIFLTILFISMLAGNGYALQNGVTIPLVADRMTDSGEEGAFLNAQVIVTNGTGHVFVDTNPYTQVDLQGSARIAAMVSSDVLGIDEKSYDFYYIIEVGSPIIGGPSAGGALTVATIAAIKNWTIKPGIAMTGMIDPDETIGPVGGIPFKLESAAKNNITLFLVPQGQLVVNITNTTISRRGIITTTNTKEVPVDLAAKGKTLNVDVREVSTVQDAVLKFTGHDISEPFSNETVFTSKYLNLLEPLAKQLKNESDDMYKNTISVTNNDLTENANNLQNRADDLMKNQKFYAATSLYFESMINILTAQWQYEYSQAKNKEQFLDNINNQTEEQIQKSENDLNKFKSNGITDVEAIGAAESRIMSANNTLENVNTLKNTNDIISSIAFAHERAKTAEWWLTLATPSGKIIPEEILKERSGWYLSQAQSVGTYVQALLSETGAGVATPADISLAQKEIDRGYYSGAIFDSLQAISRYSTMIGLAGINDPSTRIDNSANAAQTAINDARSKGIEPTLAISAYEYGGILTSPFEKISQYSYAKTIAKTTESLYYHAVTGNETNQTANITITNNTPISTKKTPEFEGITLIIAILLITEVKKIVK